MEINAADLAVWNRSQVQLELPQGDNRAQLEAVAKEFESLFAKQMLDSMRDTLNPEEDLFNGGMAQDIFEDMLYEEYARLFAQTGSLGIADMIVDQYSSSASGTTSTPARAAALYDSV